MKDNSLLLIWSTSHKSRHRVLPPDHVWQKSTLGPDITVRGTAPSHYSHEYLSLQNKTLALESSTGDVMQTRSLDGRSHPGLRGRTDITHEGLPPNRVGCYLPVTCPADSVAELITLQSSSHSCKSNSKNLMILICVRKYRIH